MKHCKDCGAQIGAIDAFCGSCGTNQNARQNVTRSEGGPSNNRNEGGSNRQPRPRRPEWIAALKTDAGMAKYKEITARIAARQLKSLVVAVIGVVVALASWVLGVPLLAIASVVTAIIAFLVFQSAEFGSDDYYSIPGSRDANGEHHCIHCGKWKGIYYEGEYKTNNKHASCTGCRTHLFTD